MEKIADSEKPLNKKPSKSNRKHATSSLDNLIIAKIDTLISIKHIEDLIVQGDET